MPRHGLSEAGVAEVAAAPRVTWLGLELPARFAGLEAECRALREGAAVYDASLRHWIRMTGEDRVSFLQGMVSNDVKGLAPGRRLHAAVLTQQGRVVTDLGILAAADHFLLDFPAQAAAAGRAALEKYIVADDVEMEAEPLVLIGVEGPRAAAVLAAVAPGTSLEGLVEVNVAGQAARLAPASVAGEAGCILGVAAAGAPAVWQALRDAGAEPVGFEALDVLRLEAGIPWVGVDMDEEMLVMEADLEDAISFKKGCYLGQEVVERVAARGHVNRRRVGLRIGGDPQPARTPLLAAGQEVGWVTSSARSPRLGQTIGMGYVRREHLAADTVLTTPGGVEVRIAPLPSRQSPT